MLVGLLSLTVFMNKDLPAFSFEGRKTAEIPVPTPSLTPYQKPVPSPSMVLLPSATLRAATAVPLTSTPTPWMILTGSQYSLNSPSSIDPLTGLEPVSPENLNRRPLAVKVSSFPRGAVRKVQSGLSFADQIYESYIEDGLTRFIAVYYSQDASRVGPVRSGRYFDEHVMRMYHAALVFADADERVEKHLMEGDLLHLLFLPRDDNCPPLCEDKSIPGYNNFFVDTAGVGAKLSDNSRQELRPTFFSSELPMQAQKQISSVYTHYSVYSYNYWNYDPSSQVYRRFSDAIDAVDFTVGEAYVPYIDQLTGQQLTADNVVVLVVPHIFHNDNDRKDQVFDINLTGSGDAYVFRDGRMIKTSWVRDRIDQSIILQDSSGIFIPLKPGRTFYEVINPESTINQFGDTMDFRFFTPPRFLTPTPTPKGWIPATPTPKHRQK